MDLDATKFLEALTATHARAYTEAITELAAAIGTGAKSAAADARKRLERVINETMGASEVLGASLMLKQAAKVLTTEGGAQFGFHDYQSHARDVWMFTVTQTVLPNVTFLESVEDMVSRTPAVIKNAAARTAQSISKLYSEGRVVAFARSAEIAVTTRVQSLIAEAARKGIGEVKIGQRIVNDVKFITDGTAKWTEGYARMAFRTNVNTAVTAGRFRQAQDPDIKAVLPAFRFDSVGDADTRHNHDAADGLIFSVDNPVWNKIAPPLGYNCRCQVVMMSLPQLARMGRIDNKGRVVESRLPPDARADANFRHGGRPDLFMVGK